MGTTRPRLRFPSPALILSCAALFTALGGSTYAATSISSSGRIHFTNAKLHNSWANSGPPSAAAGYAKDSLGVVHLRGAIAGSTSLSVAFVLPKALRPSHDLLVPVVAGAGNVQILQILRSGKALPDGPNVTNFTSLDGISFAAGE
jgi:hypothetical protein